MPTAAEFTCVVADDEKMVRARIVALASTNGLTVIGEASDGDTARDMILTREPAIAFLDIRMPGSNGLQVIEAISHMAKPPAVVLVTAYAEHALAAFALAAVDYMVKPVDANRFAAASERAKESALGRQARDAIDRIRHALDGKRPERLSVRAGGSIVSLPFADVIAFHARDDYVEAELFEATHLLSVTLNAIETVLPDPPFLRIHRSHIVNADRVTELSRAPSGKYLACLANGTDLPVARSRVSDVRSALRPRRLVTDE